MEEDFIDYLHSESSGRDPPEIVPRPWGCNKGGVAISGPGGLEEGRAAEPRRKEVCRQGFLGETAARENPTGIVFNTLPSPFSHWSRRHRLRNFIEVSLLRQKGGQ